MKAYEKYFDELNKVVKKVEETNGEAIMKAATLLADVTQKGGIIYGFGTGHSHLVVDDAFWRAATPANYCALLEPSATGNQEITKSYFVENTYGIGSLIVDYHRITPNDCMIIISNSGNNIAPVDAAIRAKEKGIPVIAITAVEYSDYLKTKHKDGVKGSSTEGHVSHVLSSRMSSRPMGWSVTGACKMSQLRAYYFNGGDMLELVRSQEKKLPKAAGAEYELLSSSQIIASEKNRHGELGKYVDTITHSLSMQNKKIVYFNAHIWGL